MEFRRRDLIGDSHFTSLDVVSFTAFTSDAMNNASATPNQSGESAGVKSVKSAERFRNAERSELMSDRDREKAEEIF
jgi:hypothetical protein